MVAKLTAKVLRAYPWQFGKGILFRRLCVDGFLKEHLAAMPNPVAMKPGFSLYTFERDFTSLWFRQFGDYEEETRRQICAVLPEGAAFVDVGASFGIHSLGVSLARPDVRVFAFEANPSSFELLSRSIELNGLQERVTPFNVALSDRAEEVSFVSNDENSGDSFIARSPSGRDGRVSRIRSFPLDELEPFWSRLRMSGCVVGCIKIDVQGAEILVLDGMRSLLARDRPAIVIECEQACLSRFGHDADALYAKLSALGYGRPDPIDHKNMLVRPA